MSTQTSGAQEQPSEPRLRQPGREAGAGPGAARVKGRGAFPVSDHCDGRVFFNTPTHINRTWLEVLRWKRAAKAVPWPKWVHVEQRIPGPAPVDGAVALTWINHSTFLLQGEFGAMLTDPHFSHRAGPMGLLGPGRVHAPGVAFERLPRIDTVLLSHDHYDHCDLASLRRLAERDDPLVVTPLGNGALVRRAGLRRVVELDWWEEAPELAGGLRVTCTPARHWSNRLRGPRNGRLWGGFYLNTPARRIYFSGDTGYHESLFSAIRSRLGSPDLAMLPIGAYEPRWFMQPQHCSPEEAVRIHREVGAARSVAMHWGCWQLADEGRDEAPELLARELARCGMGQEAFRALQPGESLVV